MLARAVGTCLWLFMSFNTLCWSSQANIMYNFAFGRNSKQMRLKQFLSDQSHSPLMLQASLSPKATNKTNWAEKLFVAKHSFPLTWSGPRFWVLREEGLCVTANVLISAANSSQEWHLWMWPTVVGKKYGRGQEWRREGWDVKGMYWGQRTQLYLQLCRRSDCPWNAVKRDMSFTKGPVVLKGIYHLYQTTVCHLR